MLNRFAATEPLLSRLVAESDRRALGSALKLAVNTALTRTSETQEGLVAAGLALLMSGAFGEFQVRAELGLMVERLDKRAWEAADVDSSVYARLFARARAVNALWYALDPDVHVAAENAIYEALHAVPDPAALRTEVARTLAPDRRENGDA
jgi:hypothetical protein